MGQGSVRQRGDSWQIRVHVTAGRYLSETLHGTKRDAQRRLRKLLEEVDQGAHRHGEHTVADLLDAWVAARGPAMSPSTQAMTRVHIECYLRPRLGELRLSRLDPATIDALYGQLRRAGVKGHPLSDGYVRRLHGTLRQALAQAVSWGWLIRNPAAGATPPPARRGGLDVPTGSEVHRILDEAARTNPPLAVYLRLAVAAGPRRGELAALRRSDLDFDAGEVVFRRALVFDPDGQVVVKPYPKSKAARRLSVDPATMAILRDHLKTLAARALLCGTGLVKDPWLFSFSPRCDTPPRPDAFTRGFIRLRNRLGLTVRLHDLRHHHATSLLTAGVDVRTVAGRLGHANPSTTLNVYAGFVPAADRRAADVAGEMLGQ